MPTSETRCASSPLPARFRGAAAPRRERGSPGGSGPTSEPAAAPARSARTLEVGAGLGSAGDAFAAQDSATGATPARRSRRVFRAFMGVDNALPKPLREAVRAARGGARRLPSGAYVVLRRSDDSSHALDLSMAALKTVTPSSTKPGLLAFDVSLRNESPEPFDVDLHLELHSPEPDAPVRRGKVDGPRAPMNFFSSRHPDRLRLKLIPETFFVRQVQYAEDGALDTLVVSFSGTSIHGPEVPVEGWLIFERPE